MAEKFPQSELPINTFNKVEQLIRSTFDRIIGTATERRDQLLVQLNDMRLDYLNKEETRSKQVSDIQKLISQLMDASIQQNPIVKLKKDQIKNLEKEQKKYEKPTPVPFPGISSEGLESLLEQLRGIGIVEDVGGHYRERINPVRKFGKKGTKKGEFDWPYGLALYRNESIYIADANNHRIQIFPTAGKFLAEFGKEHLIRPYSKALYDKWVFVSDVILNSVFEFQITNNKFVGNSAIRVLNIPLGIAVDTNGEVLVADRNNNRIAVLNSELKFRKRKTREIGKRKTRIAP